MEKKYTKTVIACYLSLVIQAICSNFITLLYFRFHEVYAIPYAQIALFATAFFTTQIVVDIFCANFVDKIGYRKCIVLSEILCALGLILLAILPNVMTNAFVGILISAIIYALGSGLIEVLASPIIEACPFKYKEKAMALLHSFYCWGVVATLLISIAFFNIFGIENWPYLCLAFAIVPLYNIYNFATCPIEPLNEEDAGIPLKDLLKVPSLWVSIVLMICAGASEISMAQWASAFVESSLGFSKRISDLVGPCLFAVFMGLSRVLYGKFGEKISLTKFMIFSGILCLGCYLLSSLSVLPILSLVGCVVCGFSVGIMWPGTISISSKRIPNASTSMFALFAMAGDIGGALGPSLVGIMSDSLNGNLQLGLLFGAIFPTILIISTIIFVLLGKKTK